MRFFMVGPSEKILRKLKPLICLIQADKCVRPFPKTGLMLPSHSPQPLWYLPLTVPKCCLPVYRIIDAGGFQHVFFLLLRLCADQM
jgi:hypothetical protein